MHQRPAYDAMMRNRRKAVAVAGDGDEARRLSEEAFTLAFYASVGAAGLLSLIGTVAYGYLVILNLL
ncbi:MAG: hypothetical protein U1F33_03280 [Alphaproteobacteria bacterium]